MKKKYIFIPLMVIILIFLISLVMMHYEEEKPEFIASVNIRDGSIDIRDLNHLAEWEEYEFFVIDEEGNEYPMEVEKDMDEKVRCANPSFDPEYDITYTIQIVNSNDRSLIWEQRTKTIDAIIFVGSKSSGVVE